MNKLQMAHQMALMLLKNAPLEEVSNAISTAWQYADAMQAEADKREKEESEKKRADIREMLKANNTFVEREGQHFDDVEWQPDWSQAPSSLITHWSMEGNGTCTWWVDEPCVDSETHFENPENPHSCCHSDAPSFNYIGNWQDSLRKRPQ